MDHGILLPLFVMGLLAATSLSAAASTAPERVLLWDGPAPGAKGKNDTDIPCLFPAFPPAGNANGMAVIVCPGGGYSQLMMGYEGSDVALWLAEHGITAFVLRYRVSPYRHPIPLEDGLRAMRTVRAHAGEWGIDPQRIGMLGFSAGGHLAATVGTHWDAGQPQSSDPIERLSSRPDFLVLLYAVISLQPSVGHVGSCKNLIGPNPDPKLVDDLSNELHVTAQTPPAFLAHSATDKVVPVKNSQLFHDALLKHGVASELIVFDHGEHGWGLARNDSEIGQWPDRCLKWLGMLKIGR